MTKDVFGVGMRSSVVPSGWWHQTHCETHYNPKNKAKKQEDDRVFCLTNGLTERLLLMLGALPCSRDDALSTKQRDSRIRSK